MSRVTIGELTEDYLPFTKEGNEATTIEVVPRKMVEMIIEKCERQITYIDPEERVFNSYARGIVDYAESVKTYAERLLREFEKEPRARVCSNCSNAGCVSPKDKLYGCPFSIGYFGGESPACPNYEERRET